MTKDKLKTVINIIFLFLTAAGAAVAARLWLADRSLWLDEGMLAWSVSNRSLSNLVSKPLDLMQSAPVLYLYAVKLITVIFGNTEITLRAFSFLSYIATVVFAYFFARNLKLKYPVAAGGCVACCGVLLKYSCEFKPYVTDCAAVLGVLLLYSAAINGKLNFYILGFAYAAIIWISNPACFFIAGILIFEFFKNIKHPKKVIICGLICTASFGAYFAFWLYPVIAKGDMSAYWANMRFPLIPTSLSDIRHGYELIRQLCPTPLLICIFLLAAAACVKGLINKKHEISITVIGFALALIASFLGLFPIAMRLWVFAYPLCIILALEFLNFDNKFSSIVLVAAMLVSLCGIRDYKTPESVYVWGDNLNPIVDYLKEKNEFVYVYVHSVPTFCYKMNYQIPENVMLGDGYFEEFNPDINKILEHDSGYIVISHPVGRRTEGLFEVLSSGFTVTEEFSDHGTILYHYKKT